ncbi:hypothetical protein [Candidatus Nitrospira bockiana]
MADIGSLIVKIGVNAKELEQAFGKLSRDGQSFGDKIQQAGKVGALGLATITTAAVGAGAAIFAITKSAADTGDELFKMSKKVGVSVEDLSALRHAAELSDVDLSTLQISFKQLSNNLFEAAQGTKEQADLFRLMNIAVTDSTGALRPAADVMLEVSDLFAGMENETERAALAVKVFGKSGLDMIPLLEQGAAAIRAQMQEAELLGVTWDTKTAKAAEEFNDNLTRMGKVLEGVKNIIAQAFLPVLNDIVVDVLEWFKANEKVIKQELKQWAEGAAAALRDMATHAKSVTEALGLMRQAWQELKALGIVQFLGGVVDVLTASVRILFNFFVKVANDFAAGLIAPFLLLPGAAGDAMQQAHDQWFNAARRAQADMDQASRDLLVALGIMERQQQQQTIQSTKETTTEVVETKKKGGKSILHQEQEVVDKIRQLQRELTADLAGESLKKLAAIEAEEAKRIDLVKGTKLSEQERGRLLVDITRVSVLKRGELEQELRDQIVQGTRTSEEQQRAEAQKTYRERVGLIRAIVKDEKDRETLILQAAQARDEAMFAASKGKLTKLLELEKSLTDGTLTAEQKRLRAIVTTADERKRLVEQSVADETRRAELLAEIERVKNHELLGFVRERVGRERELMESVSRDVLGAEEGQRLAIQKTFDDRMRQVQELKALEQSAAEANATNSQALAAALDALTVRYAGLETAIRAARDRQMELLHQDIAKRQKSFLDQLTADTLSGEQRKRFEIQRTYEERIRQIDELKLKETEASRASVLAEQARQQQLRELATQYPSFWQRQLDQVQQSAVFTWSSIQQQFSSTLAGLIQGTSTLQQFWDSMLNTILQATINTGVQLAVQWAKDLLFKKAQDTEALASHTAMETSRTAITTAQEGARLAAVLATNKAIEGGAIATLASIGAVGKAAIGVMESIVIATAGVFTAISAALAASIVGAPMAPAYAAAAAAVTASGTAATVAGLAAIEVALGSAIVAATASLATPFAEGGIAMKPTFGVFGEKGPEAILPIDRLSDFLGGGGEQRIIFLMDGRRWAEYLLSKAPGEVRLRLGTAST